MKVLYLIDSFIPFSRYQVVGATNIAVQLIESLSEKCKNTTFVLGCRVDNQEFADNYCKKHPNIKLLQYYPANRTHLKKAFDSVYDYLNNNPNEEFIIHNNISSFCVAPYLVKLLEYPNIKKVLTTLHTWGETAMLGFNYREEFITLFNSSKVFPIFVSNSTAESYFSTLKYKAVNPYSIIPNATPMEFLVDNIEEKAQSELLKLGIPSDWLWNYQLMIGRMVQSKFPLEIVDAVLSTPNEKLILVSNKINDKPDEYCNKLINKLQDSEVKKRVIHLENLTTEQCMSLMKYAVCLNIRSTSDTFGLVCLEAALMKCPTLGWNCSGITETMNLLRDGGCKGFDFPKRLSYEKKCEYHGKLMEEMHNNPYRFDTSKLPDDLHWNNLINNYLRIYNNEGIR